MEIILNIGLLIISGYLLGEIAEKLGLPKISGYILAGICLNPDLFGIISESVVKQTNNLLSISLSVIVFSIGGTLSMKKIRKTGKTTLLLTVFESLSAFIFVFLLVFICLYFWVPIFNSVHLIIAVSLVLASLASPTDPSATMAVIHEYKAEGRVSSSMLGIAAFDDITGIIIYTITISFANSFMGGSNFQFSQVLLDLGKTIGGSALIGLSLGYVFKYITHLFRNESDGSLIVLVFGMILLSYGISDYVGFEPLLTSMIMGIVVINTNTLSEKIFQLLDRYTDELIFVIFFSLSGLHLQLASLGGSLIIVVIYIVARFAGKYVGIYSGAKLMKADPVVQKYTAWGLFPQGGIVIGLALLLKDNPAFDKHASVIIGIVIGAALVHEILGPIISKMALKRAGEIN